MKYNPEIHNWRTIRLKDHDYTRPGAYFVTICAHGRECIFGNIENGEMKLNEYGKIAEREWTRSSTIRAEIEMDEFVVMPNHVHGIVIINKMKTIIHILLASALIINTAGCEDTSAPGPYMSPIETTTQTEETQSGEDEMYSKIEMRGKLAGEIQEMISDKSCKGDWSCESTGYGYKPCGGNNTYLVYSSENLDEEMLTETKKRPQHVILRPPRPKNLRTKTVARAWV